MPTLFISYKRGTAAVAPLMEKLRAAHYRLWFDRDEIHLGDPDWQARIDHGIGHSDGVILNVTPAACESEAVRYEVKKALDLGRPIFPIILERIVDYGAAIRALGLPERQHFEDFTDVPHWDEQIQRLLRALEAHGLRVTRHDLPRERDPSNPNYVLHQRYLKQLVDRVGMLNLAQINPKAKQVYLEDVYIDSPTALTLSVEVQNWNVVNWWVSEQHGMFTYYGYFAEPMPADPGNKPEEMGFERAPLEGLLAKVDDQIKQFRERETEDARNDRSYIDRWRDGGYFRQAVFLHLQHIAAACDRLVILGAPGSGKSTFVRFLALCLAASGIDDRARPVNITSLENWPHGALTPIYVELRRFVSSRHFPADLDTAPTADHLWAYIQHDILDDDLRNYADDLRYDLEHGHAVLILDGLDEIPYPEGKLKARQQQLIALAQSLNTRYAASRVIVASRPYAYEGWKLPGFEAVTITAFEDSHREQLAARLYQAAGFDVTAAHEKASALNQQLAAIDPELKDRPLFVTLMAQIFLKGDEEGLPTRRGALYRESILLLLDRWTQSKPGAPSLIEILGDRSLDDLYARLAALAYDVHERFGEQTGTPEIYESLLYRHLKPLGRGIAAELIPYLSENAGVLVSPGQNNERDVFHFAHRTFQEYLAAAHLMTLCLEADSYRAARDHIMGKPQVWRVPCTLAGDVLADTGRRGYLWDLLADLTDEDIPKNINADDPRWWAVWFASGTLQEQGMIEDEKLRRNERAVCNQLRDWIVALIETPQALNPVERATCGRALAAIGDPRPGVGLRADGLPDIAWADEILAGNYPIGDPGLDDNPPREIEIKRPYRVSKYLITQQQYLAFQIDTGERGYACPDWWAGLAADERDKRPAEPRFKFDNHPMESVNWYQAVAFCRWLTERYREAGLLETLPSPQTPLPTVPAGLGEGLENQYRQWATQAMVYIARDLRQRQTSAESLLWECLRDRRLAGIKFRRQHPVAKTAYVVDFFSYDHRLVIELDGGIHSAQVEADAQRQRELEGHGLRVLRFPNDQIFAKLEDVLTVIAQTALGSPLPAPKVRSGEG